MQQEVKQKCKVALERTGQLQGWLDHSCSSQAGAEALDADATPFSCRICSLVRSRASADVPVGGGGGSVGEVVVVVVATGEEIMLLKLAESSDKNRGVTSLRWANDKPCGASTLVWGRQ